MQLVSKLYKRLRFLLCVIDIYSKYAWVIPLKDKKGITIINSFQKILKESNHKPNKQWVVKDSEFYNSSMKSWLEKNGIEMYSTHNEGKSVIAERFIKTLKNKICKYMTSLSKNVCIDKLDDIVNKYNNTYHNTIRIKPADVKPNTCIDFNKEINNKDQKLIIDIFVRISKYKNIFAKGYVPNWSKGCFVIKKVKNTVSLAYIDLKGGQIVRTLYEKYFQKLNQKEFRTEKVIKRKGDKLHVKWKGSDS